MNNILPYVLIMLLSYEIVIIVLNDFWLSWEMLLSFSSDLLSLYFL